LFGVVAAHSYSRSFIRRTVGFGGPYFTSFLAVTRQRPLLMVGVTLRIARLLWLAHIRSAQ
jgi:hypothetical protein